MESQILDILNRHLNSSEDVRALVRDLADVPEDRSFSEVMDSLWSITL